MSVGVALNGLATGVEFQQLSSGALGLGTGRSVYVYARGTSTTVQVFADQAMTQAMSQPLTTASDGSIPGFVAGGVAVDFYDVASGRLRQAEPVAAGDVGGLLNGTKLPASVVNGSLSPFTTVTGFGHSYVLGSVATNNHGFVPKLGVMLGLPTTDYGIGGASVGIDNQSPAGNGWVTVLQQLAMANGGGPYISPLSLVCLMFGLNDLANFGVSAQAMTNFKHSLRTVISRIRSASTGVFGFADPTISLGGTWASITATNLNSGSGVAYTTTNGATATINVPSDFPGGTVAVGLEAEGGTAGTHTFTLDGSAAGSIAVTASLANTVSGKGNPNVNGIVYRFTGLGPGAHTIVDTVSAITSFSFFNYWQIEAPEPPVILLPTQPRLNDYSVYTTAGSPFTPTDAMVQALNVAIRQVAAEFDRNVVVVELDPLFAKNAALFGSGSAQNRAHPSDAGHSVIAAACLAALQRFFGPWLPALATAA